MTDEVLQFDTLREAVARLPDDRLMPMRLAALEAFGKQGLPTLRDEDWKYTNIAPALGTLVDAPASDVLEAAIDTIREKIDADWLVVANGRADITDIFGVEVSLLSDSDVSLDSPLALTQLNTALLQDGIRIHVSDGAEVTRPIGLLFVDDASGGAGLSQGRIEIEMAPGSRASFVEYHASQGEAKHHANTVINLKLGDNAQVDYVRIQDRDRSHSQTARLEVSAGKDSRFNHCGFDFGGALIRNDLAISIDSAGAAMSFDGLYLAGNGQHIDNHTRVDHRVGPAQSRQEYRGILNGNARCIWNGKAIVHAGADGTDAAQANHNLLLSEKAEIDAKPELEIYADDVKCSHGTTVGQLDEASLYYLRTRGLDRQLAQQVLMQAFAQAIVNRAAVASTTELLAQMIDARLERLLGGIQK
ncbi:MAG: Fe-S cluster assembly protein SufD [Woeseiaceae bacterium]|nr:Fe-S cluster assembly protein SufD [Woeseiaceae bacterium]